MMILLCTAKLLCLLLHSIVSLPIVNKFVRFQVLMVASMKMAVFWVVAPCSLVEVYRCFRGACCLHHPLIALMMEAANTSETLISFYQTTWRNNREDSHLYE
jgi:hypothetical protein